MRGLYVVAAFLVAGTCCFVTLSEALAYQCDPKTKVCSCSGAADCAQMGEKAICAKRAQCMGSKCECPQIAGGRSNRNPPGYEGPPSVEWECNGKEKKCYCDGAEDCYNLGHDGPCSGSVNCPGNKCDCDYKPGSQ